MVELTTLLFLFSIVVFVIGLLLGYLVSGRNEDITKSDLQIAVAVLVTVVWGISIVAEIIIASYSVNLLVHGIMGVVSGYLFSNGDFNIDIGP